MQGQDNKTHTKKTKFEKTKQAKTELLVCPLQPDENYQQKNKEGHCKNYWSYVKHKPIFHFVFKYSTTCCVLSFINMQSRKNKESWNLLYQNKLHYYDQHKHFFVVQRCANLGGRHIRGQTLLSAWKPSRLQFITMENGFIIFRLCFWVILTHDVRSKQVDKLIYLTAWLSCMTLK